MHKKQRMWKAREENVLFVGYYKYNQAKHVLNNRQNASDRYQFYHATIIIK